MVVRLTAGVIEIIIQNQIFIVSISQKLNLFCLIMKKSEVEKTICADTSEFTKTTDLVCLQSKVDNLYVEKP